MSRSPSADPLVGDVLDGRYEVLQRLARGGMATVYRAWDRRLERIVAIKVMHEGLVADAEFIGKFDREARAAARLCDQNVVAIFDQGHDHGRPYIVMEFIQGHTLRNLITKQAPLAPLQALQLLEPVAAALAVAHESGLVHRDVKPENVLISDTGAIKVADFGLARSAQASAATQGMLIGTVSYLPPELLSKAKADSWSDIYSTGVMLFEMLTGEKPYTHDDAITVAYRHVNEDIPAPSQVLAAKSNTRSLAAQIPDYLDALVLACTRRNPQLRPQNGRELLRRIRRARKALEQGIMHDEALCAVMYPAGQLPTVQTSANTTQIAKPFTPVAGARHDSAQLPLRPNQLVAAMANDVATESAELEHTPTIDVDEFKNFYDPALDPDLNQSRPHPAVLRGKFRAVKKEKKRRKIRAIFTTIFALLLIAAVAAGVWWLAVGRFVTTPSVINQTKEVAIQIAEANELQIVFTEEYSETTPAGLVISSKPEPGDKVVRHSTITAVLSRGPERYPMPKVVGLPVEEAKTQITNNNLQVGTITQDWSEDIPENNVISANHGEGEQLKRDTAIDLVISKGREPLDVPKVVGKTKDEAFKQLSDIGFAPEVAEERFDSTIPAGEVIAQDPIDTKGYRGDKVRLVISKGPEMVTVPNVIGMPRAAGVRALQEAGLDVQVESSFNPFLSRIKSTDPQPGISVSKGSRVKVVIG